MTNEEAINMLKSKMDGHTDTSYEWVETVRMAIKALEQQPCEDCVSRETVIEWLKDKDIIKTKNQEENARRELAELPPVTPQPKTGHWIVIREEFEFMGGIVNEPRGCKCSNCNKVVRFKSDFCPNCGAKMEVEE